MEISIGKGILVSLAIVGILALSVGAFRWYQTWSRPAQIVSWTAGERGPNCLVAMRHGNAQALWCEKGE